MAKNSKDRIVYQRADGKWVNKRMGSQKAGSVHEKQHQAVDAARDMLRAQGGGELVIKGKDGKIRQKDTVSRRA
jgi:hypothetical protein